MNTARKIDYDYYDDMARNLRAENRDFVEKRYRKQSVQAPHIRIIYGLAIFALVFVLLSPFSMLLTRHAAIHEKQYDNYRLKLMTAEYVTKTNEIKERLESGTSLDDLKVFATEQLDMVKSDRSRVISLKDNVNSIADSSVRFSISSGIEKEQYVDGGIFGN